MSPSPITIGVGNDARPRALLLTAAQGEPPPAQRQPPGPGQAEFVICDQTIEAMFSDFKSRGFGLEDSHLRRPERLDRRKAAGSRFKNKSARGPRGLAGRQSNAGG